MPAPKNKANIVKPNLSVSFFETFVTYYHPFRENTSAVPVSSFIENGQPLRRYRSRDDYAFLSSGLSKTATANFVCGTFGKYIYIISLGKRSSNFSVS